MNYFKEIVKWYNQKNFDLLPNEHKDFLKERISYEKSNRSLDDTFLFSAFEPNKLFKGICRRLELNGFMRKKKAGYVLTKRIDYLKI